MPAKERGRNDVRHYEALIASGEISDCARSVAETTHHIGRSVAARFAKGTVGPRWR